MCGEYMCSDMYIYVYNCMCLNMIKHDQSLVPHFFHSTFSILLFCDSQQKLAVLARLASKQGMGFPSPNLLRVLRGFVWVYELRSHACTSTLLSYFQNAENKV